MRTLYPSYASFVMNVNQVNFVAISIFTVGSSLLMNVEFNIRLKQY